MTLALIFVACSHNGNRNSKVHGTKHFACSVFPEWRDGNVTLPSHVAETPYSKKLLCQLSAWNGLPWWIRNVDEMRRGWAAQLHGIVVGNDWPEYLKRTASQVIDADLISLGSIRSSGGHSVIEIPHMSPVHLQELQGILDTVVEGGPEDPSDGMFMDGGNVAAATKRLARMVAMLKHTSYLRGAEPRWENTLVSATRFIYYHELGHAIAEGPETFAEKYGLDPAAMKCKEELRADYLALILFLVEVRNRPDLWGDVFFRYISCVQFFGGS